MKAVPANTPSYSNCSTSNSKSLCTPERRWFVLRVQDNAMDPVEIVNFNPTTQTQLQHLTSRYRIKYCTERQMKFLLAVLLLVIHQQSGFLSELPTGKYQMETAMVLRTFSANATNLHSDIFPFQSPKTATLPVPSALDRIRSTARRPPPRPLISRRTWYVAAYNARQKVTSTATQDSFIVWKWTEQTERKLHEVYDRIMIRRKEKCRQLNTTDVLVMEKAEYGLGSRMRDTLDLLIAGIGLNRTVLHHGPATCPREWNSVEEMANATTTWLHDPYMLCLFDTFSSCQGVSSVNPPYVARINDIGNDIYPNFMRGYHPQIFDSLWNSLLPFGIYATNHSEDGMEVAVEDDPRTLPVSLDQKRSVVKALIMNHVFGPMHVSSLVQERVKELESRFLQHAAPGENNYGNMLVIHLRRTDKKKDYAKLLPHETRTDINDTLVVICGLMKAAKRLSGMEFQSIFFMSDEPSAFSANVTTYLSSMLPSRPNVFFNDFVTTKLSSNAAYRRIGHTSLTEIDHAMMDLQLTASMTFAAKHGTYLIGYGRSGVSQTIAQLIGSKFQMCPSQISLFEDDTVLLENLEETKESVNSR